MATPEHIRAEVHPGDKVRVIGADGTTQRITVAALGEASLSGTAGGARIELPYRDIRQIDVDRLNTGTTIALVAGVAVVAGVLIATGGGSHSPGYNR